jgi:hypothetical protein
MFHQRSEIEQLAVEEMRRPHSVIARRIDSMRPGWSFPIAQHLADALALQVLLRAAQGARNDRKAPRLAYAARSASAT